MGALIEQKNGVAESQYEIIISHCGRRSITRSIHKFYVYYKV